MTRARRSFLRHDSWLPFAHRGGAAVWPENTITSFAGALALGLPFIETDVRLTHDGVFMIFHDARVDRTTEGTGLVAERTLEDMKRLDAGFRFDPDMGFPFRGQDVRVPTLEAVLKAWPDARFNVDLKDHGRAPAEALWAFLEQHGVQERVLVASTDVVTLRHFRRVSRGAVATSAGALEVLAFKIAVETGQTGRLHPPFDALQVPTRMSGVRVIDPTFVSHAHELGLQVHVWTVDEVSVMRRLLVIGVDGLMTDRPDRMATLLAPLS